MNIYSSRLIQRCILTGHLSGPADAKGAALQASQYGAVIAQMAAAAALLGQEEQVPGMITGAKFDAAQLPGAIASWQKSGLPAAAIAALSSAGLSQSDIESLSTAAADAGTAESAADPAGALVTTVRNLAQTTLTLRDEAPLVLALPSRLESHQAPTPADLVVPALHSHTVPPKTA